MTDWPRCKHCGERMCCDGKGNYECVCDEALKKGQEGSMELPGFPIVSMYVPLDNMITDVIMGSCRVRFPIPIQAGDIITYDSTDHIITVTRLGIAIVSIMLD